MLFTKHRTLIALLSALYKDYEWDRKRFAEARLSFKNHRLLTSLSSIEEKLALQQVYITTLSVS